MKSMKDYKYARFPEQPGFRIGSALRGFPAPGVGAWQPRPAGEPGGGVGGDEAAAADATQRV